MICALINNMIQKNIYQLRYLYFLMLHQARYEYRLAKPSNTCKCVFIDFFSLASLHLTADRRFLSSLL